jgi:hypothetical protein
MLRKNIVSHRSRFLARVLFAIPVSLLLATAAGAGWGSAAATVVDAATADARCLQSDLTTAAGGGANNQVMLHNIAGGNPQVRGMAQLNQIPGPTVAPVNCAVAQNGVLCAPSLNVQTVECTGCDSYAVALQINLYKLGATDVSPVNIARAQNFQCLNCVAESEAFQYNLPVDDPTQVPGDVDTLIRQFNDELRLLQISQTSSPQAAAAQIDQIIAQFQELATVLNQQRSLAP